MRLSLVSSFLLFTYIIATYFLLKKGYSDYYDKVKVRIANASANEELLSQYTSKQQNLSKNNIQQSLHPKHRIMILYSSCEDDHFKLDYLKIPTMKLLCDQEKKNYQCKETGPYLKFIIDNYDIPLAEIYIFVHGHIKSWHYIQPIERMIGELLNSYDNYLSKEDYGGIECVWNYCPTLTGNVVNNIFIDLFSNTSIPSKVPSAFSYPCCSSFFVNSKSLKIRSKDEYITLLNNMERWSVDNYNKSYSKSNPGIICGRVYEMMWNRIFSNVELVKKPPYCKSFKNEVLLPLLITE